MKAFIVRINGRENFDAAKFKTHMDSYDAWARLAPDLWMVSYHRNAAKLRDRIRTAMDDSCAILVIEITRTSWATLDISQEITDWMKRNV